MSDVGGITGISGINGTIDVSGPVSVANALTAIRRQHATSVIISDSTQNILKNLDALSAVATSISTLTTTDASQSMVITGAQYQKDSAALALWGAGGQTVSVTAAKATFTATPASYVTSVSVTDSRAAIQAHIDNLQALASSGLLKEIVQSGSAGPLTITAAQAYADQDALDKIKNGGYSLAITGASVSDVLGLDTNPALSTNSKVKSIAIVDTTDAIATNLDDLQKVGLRIKSIAQTDAASAHIEVTGQQYQQDKLVLGKIISADLLDVMDASASQARALATDAHVVTVDINDTAAAISKNWSLLQKLTDLNSATITDSANAVRLTQAQYTSGASVIATLLDQNGGQSFKLAVTGVSAASAATISGGANVTSIDVTDSAAAIATSLDDLETVDGQGQLNTVTLASPRGAITLDAVRLQGSAAATTQSILDKIKGGNYNLSVTGAATADLAALTGDRHVTAIAVSDTGANIGAALDTLGQLGSRVSTLEQTDAGTAINVTQTQLETRATVLGKIGGGYTVNVSGATALKATGDAQNSHVAGISVSDTAKSIAANWTSLRALGSDLASLTQSDGAAITLSAADYQMGIHDNLVSKIAGSPAFSVNNASVADATSLASDSAVTQIDVTDDSNSIVSNMTALETLAGGTKLHSITNSTPTDSLSLAASDLTAAQDVLGLIKGGSYTLAVGGVAAADAKALVTGNSKIASVDVTGDAAAIVANLSDLNSIGRKLSTITQTDAGTTKLQMTGSAFQQDAATLAKIEGGYLADLTAVTAAKAAIFAGNTYVSTLAVTDSGANLASAWGTLAQMGGKLTGVNQSDSTTLQLSMADWTAGQGLRAKFASDPNVAISNAAVSDVDGLQADTAVQSIKVHDAASAISAGLSDLAAQNKLTQIELTDATEPLTMSATDYAGSSAVLGLVKNGNYLVALSNVTAAGGAALASDAHVASTDIVDTASNVASNFSALSAANNLGSITLSDQNGTIALTAAQIFASGSTLDKITGSYQLAATGVAMADLADIQTIPQVTSIGISDSADNVSANFADILALGGNLSQIQLTDSSPVLALSESDWSTGASALGTISGSYQVDVTGTVAGDAQTVGANANVRHVEVADTASNIAGQWDNLVSLYNGGSGKLTDLSLTDNNPLILTTDQQTAGAAMIAALLPNETIQTA